VTVGCSECDPQDGGDFLGAISGSNELENLGFPFRQGFLSALSVFGRQLLFRGRVWFLQDVPNSGSEKSACKWRGKKLPAVV
jgi:hypothetical protein